MKNFTLKAFLFLSILSTTMYAQKDKNKQTSKEQPTHCGTDEYNAKLLANNPNMMGSEAFKKMIDAKIKDAESQRSNNSMVIVTIPLVVHVLHNGEPVGTGANISDAQVLSQITVMNEDFRRMAGTPGDNSNPVGADVEVEFCLVQQTPDGCPTNGINRVNICQDGVGSMDEMNYQKTLTIWDSSSYMNMWSSKYTGGFTNILGYAQFPGGPADTDGVSANYTTFGSSDYDDGSFTLNAPYDKGRTMTHEVGHYLGLYHTFQGGCDGVGDEVADTPAVATSNFGCPAGTDSCVGEGPDMIENYMDYTDDTCMNTYTIGQKARITAVLASSRIGLTTSTACAAVTAEANDAEATIECMSVAACSPLLDANIKISNWGTAQLTSAIITYDVDGAGSTTYNWTGSLAYGESDSIALPTITAAGGTQNLNVTITGTNGGADARACNNTDSKEFSAAGSFASTTQVHLALTLDQYGSETTWEFKDSNDTVLYSGGPYTDGTDGTVVNDSFNVVQNECYTFTIEDGFGDGICCTYGNGSYELTTDDSTVIFSGGDFASIENTNISTMVLSVNEYFINAGISIYPNPATEALNIKVSNNNLPDSYKIYNVLGQVMSEVDINSASDLHVNTTAFSNGMYFIKITKDNNAISLPFIKK